MRRCFGVTAATAVLVLGMAWLVLAGLGSMGAAARGPLSTADVALVGPRPSDTAVDVGETTTIQLVVQDIGNLYGADVRLLFDPRYLEVVDADPANPGVQIALLPSFLSPDWVLRNVADNQDGSIWYAVTQVKPTRPVTGTGALADISFRGLVAGTSPITVTYSKLVRRDGTTIDTRAEHGRIVVTTGGSTATPGPSPTSRPTTERTATATSTDEPVDNTPTATPTPNPTRTPVLKSGRILLPKLYKPRR
jgi:hypothetical protein